VRKGPAEAGPSYLGYAEERVPFRSNGNSGRRTRFPWSPSEIRSVTSRQQLCRAPAQTNPGGRAALKAAGDRTDGTKLRKPPTSCLAA
jgi:hypothetical protein